LSHAADHEVAIVDIEELGVDARNRRRVRLIVVMDELDLAAKKPAFGIDFFCPDLRAEQGLLAVGRQRTGQRHAEADLDWFGALREHRNSRQCGRKQGCTNAGIDAAPCYAFGHGPFLHKAVVHF
jgi:hypothetical protein